MQSASLFQFGSGGGGPLYDGHKVLVRDIKFKEHSFQSKDRDTGVVTQTYEPGCMLALDLQILDPNDPADEKQVYTEQFLSVGNLPKKRLEELGWKVDPKRVGGLGGYQPSEDNETAAVEGPFIVMDGKQDIWNQADYAIFMHSVMEAGLKEHLDRLAAQGISCLKGSIFDLAAHAKPKSKNAKPDAKERLVPVVTGVDRWGWEEASEAPAEAAPAPAAKKPAAKKAAAPAAAPAPAPAAAAPAAAPAAPTGGVTWDDATPEEQTKIMEAVAVLLESGPIKTAMLGTKLFAAFSKEGAARTRLVQIGVSPTTLTAGAEAGLWVYSGDTVSPMTAQ
jgi:hypothetical protein